MNQATVFIRHGSQHRYLMDVKAAVVQAEPEWLDLQASVRKTCNLIREAAEEGAHIIAFPELWVPGYPDGSGITHFRRMKLSQATNFTRCRPMDFGLNIEFIKNSLVIESVEMEELRACAAANNIVVCLGFSERDSGSVYIAQCTINSDGGLLMTRRKLKPVHMERTIFGDGHGPSLRNVVQTPMGRIGALSCGVRGAPFNP